MKHVKFALLFMIIILFNGRAGEMKFERMAALQETVVSIHEGKGLPGVFTYDHDPNFWLDNLALGKLKAGIKIGSDILWLHEDKNIIVRSIPAGEGVEITGEIRGHKIHLEAIPTKIGRDTIAWEGAALFNLSMDPPAEMVLEYGKIGRVRIHGFRPDLPYRPDYLMDPEFRAIAREKCQCAKNENCGILSAENFGMNVAVRFESDAGLELTYDNDSIRAVTVQKTGSARVLAAFSKDSSRAVEISQSSMKSLEQEARNNFKNLLESAWIKTPSREMNDTFRSSLITLEYNWCRPLGWIEAIHHWGILYSQQQNWGADWIGQTDRSKEMLLTHAKFLFPEGKVPTLDSSTRQRNEFGGWNQFYVWGIEHYWHQTGDLEFLEKIWEPLTRVVKQTFEEYDPDGNLLLSWGAQIHNQEDYVNTPWDGASPTMAGIEMLRIQAEIASALGKTQDSNSSALLVKKAEIMLRKSLWNNDLGRYIYYLDQMKLPHLDGQYHTLIWPVMHDLLDPRDSHMSLRHLEDVLTGDEGEIYASNNFPSHVIATVGSQAGGQQQPWGAFAWARMGQGKKAARSLEWISRRVQEDPHLGSWPEVSHEPVPAWFSPPAGVFIQGVVEGVFGLKLDKPRNTLLISPCLPEDWPGASLHLPDFDMAIEQSPISRRIEMQTRELLHYEYRVAIPPAKDISVLIDGKKQSFELEQGVQRLFVIFSSGESRGGSCEIRYSPLVYEVRHSKEVARGGTLDVRTKNLVVLGVDDPCGVLACWEQTKDGISLHIRENIARDAGNYGVQGLKSLTRRTVFLEAGISENRFWEPVDFSVMPDSTLPRSPDFDTAAFFRDKAQRADELSSRMIHIALPENILYPDTSWKDWKNWLAYAHMPWATLPPPLESLGKMPLLSPSCTPGLSFANPSRKVAVASRRIGKPVITIPINKKTDKIFVLVLPLVDNHDVFSPVGRFVAECGDRAVFEKTLYFPGDLDWWGPAKYIGDFATYGKGWCSNPAWETESCVMNVIGMDLGKARDVVSLTLETEGYNSSLGIAGVTILGDEKSAK